MLRYVAGGMSAVLAIAAGILLWRSAASGEAGMPPPPKPATILSPLGGERKLERPPEASEKSKEEKRFARADRDRNGRISLDELYGPRRKAFAKLDGDGDGRLDFGEWAAGTAKKFAKADSDHSGWLSPREYESTKPKAKARPRCRC
jgi:hypothetical protein